MKRSNYPGKVHVNSADLKHTESSKISAILSRFVDTSQPGVVSGLAVTVSNSGNTLFDIGSGYGYAPKGELAQLNAALTGQGISGSSSNITPNLIGLMYQESTSRGGAAQTDNVTQPRQTNRSVALRVFTAAQYSALPVSNDTDLSADAQDRFLICAVAQHAAVETDPLVITLPPTFDLIKSITQPSNITGVRILSVSQATQDSDPFPAVGAAENAQLVFEPVTPRLAYKAPFDTVDLSNASPFDVVGLGLPVSVSSSGTYTLTSANGTDSITVEVEALMLPTQTTSSTSDAPTVTTLYENHAQRGSAKDDQHRHVLGTNIPDLNNAHGLRVADIAALLESFPGTLDLGTSLLTTEEQAEVPRLRFPASAQIDASTQVKAAQSIEWVGGSSFFGGANTRSIRVYHSSSDTLWIAHNCRFNNNGGSSTWERSAANNDDTSANAMLLELSPSAIVVYGQSGASADSWLHTAWDRTQLFHNTENNTTSLNGVLELGAELLTGTTDTQRARLTANYNDSGISRTLLFISEGATSPGVDRIRVYRAPSSEPLTAPDVIEFVANALWNEDTSQWSRDGAGDATKVAFGRDGVVISHRDSALASPWVEGDWALSVQLQEFGAVVDGGTSNFVYTPAKSHTRFIDVMRGRQTGNAFTDLQTYWQKQAASATATQLYVPVYLPPGAIITGVTLTHGNTLNNAGQMYATMVRTIGAGISNLNSGGVYTAAAGNTAIADSAAVTDAALTLDQFLTIDASYLYWLVIQNGIAATDDEDMDVYGAKITFTLPTVAGPYG